jgi:hypothetical protein
VLPQETLVVKHIATDMRLRRKQVRQRFADGSPGRRERTVGNEISQMAGEMNFGHGRTRHRMAMFTSRSRQ